MGDHRALGTSGGTRRIKNDSHVIAVTLHGIKGCCCILARRNQTAGAIRIQGKDMLQRYCFANALKKFF